MKKILCAFVLLICVLGLCGCESSKKAREQLFADLKKAKIISSSMEQIDTMTYSQWGLEWCTKKNYYVYKDKNSKIILITYDSGNFEKDDDYEHLVTIYYDVMINDDVNYADSNIRCSADPAYEYQDGKLSREKRYEFDSKKTYGAKLKKTLLSKKYVFTEQ